jgi:hypothetical protein
MIEKVKSFYYLDKITGKLKVLIVLNLEVLGF